MFAKEKIIELAKIVDVNVMMSGTIKYHGDPLPALFYNEQENNTIPLPELQLKKLTWELYFV